MEKIVKFLPCGFFFAATNALMSMAYGLRISASMAVVVGKVYTPVCALGSRWVVGKFYMWLEWFAIVILTLSSMAFGSLRTLGDSGSSSHLAILCVACSATASAMNSLLIERLMKTETEPFAMQKVRLDCGSVFWSALFLPIMGLLGDAFGFQRGAYWNHRPLTRDCDARGACDGPAFVPAPDQVAAGCTCGRGVFACWDNPLIYAMLVICVVHSTVTGLVVKKFSSVYRAVADAFSLLLIYFVGDPLLSGTSLRDVSLNLTALILPLSSQTFSQAAEELQKVDHAVAASSGKDGRAGEAPGTAG